MTEEWFGKNLKVYRSEHRLTQREMADRIQISTGHVSALECGRRRPGCATIQAFERMKEMDEWIESDILSELTDEEFDSYMNLWQRMHRLGADREKEAITAFIGLIELL